MRKYLCCYLLILGVLLGCSGCTVGNDHRIIQEISNRLDTDIANGKIVINEDSHSGFLNDGTSIIAIQFSDDSFQNAVKGKRNWMSFPLDKTVQTLLYGYESDELICEPYITDENNNAIIPEITNGYYFLYDRQAKNGRAAGADILRRDSLNFTVAVYDSDSRILYYCEMDT